MKYDLNSKNHFVSDYKPTPCHSPKKSAVSVCKYHICESRNPHLKPSDNYNADLKWDFYLSPSG